MQEAAPTLFGEVRERALLGSSPEGSLLLIAVSSTVPELRRNVHQPIGLETNEKQHADSGLADKTVRARGKRYTIVSCYLSKHTPYRKVQSFDE